MGNHHKTNAARRRVYVCAFSLIELLVVVAIIGILVAIILPALAQARKSAARVAEMATGQQLTIAYHAYADDHQGVLMPGTIQEGLMDFPPLVSVLGPSFHVYDEKNQLLNPKTGSKYPWRILPYLNFAHEAVVVNKKIRQDQAARQDLPGAGAAKSRQFAIGVNPTFGINCAFVGGKEKETVEEKRVAVRRSDQILFPTRLLVFASSRGYTPEYYNAYDSRYTEEIQEGWSWLEPPRTSSFHNPVLAYDRIDQRWDPKLPPIDFGWLDLRHSAKAVAMQFDGHAEMLGLAVGSRAELRDLRRWCNAALTENWKFGPPVHQ